jgi:hypothetical protein
VLVLEVISSHNLKHISKVSSLYSYLKLKYLLLHHVLLVMGTADEASFVELLIANERVCSWLDELENLDISSKRYVVIVY